MASEPPSEAHLTRANQHSMDRSGGYISSLRSSSISLKDLVPRKKRSTDSYITPSNGDPLQDQENRPQAGNSSESTLFSNLTNRFTNHTRSGGKRKQSPQDSHSTSRPGHQQSLLPILTTRNRLNPKPPSSRSLESTAPLNVTGKHPPNTRPGGSNRTPENHIESKHVSADKSPSIASTRHQKKVHISHTRKVTIKRTPRVAVSPLSSRHSIPSSLNVGHGRAAPNILSTTHTHGNGLCKPTISWIPRLASRTNKITNPTRHRSQIQSASSADRDITSLRSNTVKDSIYSSILSNSTSQNSGPASPRDENTNPALHERNFEEGMPSVHYDNSVGYMAVDDINKADNLSKGERYGSLKNRVVNGSAKRHAQENAAMGITDVIDISYAYGASDNLIAHNDISSGGQPPSVPLPSPSSPPSTSSSRPKSYYPSPKPNTNPFLSPSNAGTAEQGRHDSDTDEEEIADIPFSISPSKHTVKITFEDMSVKKAKYKAGGLSPGVTGSGRVSPGGAPARHVSFTAYRTEKVVRERSLFDKKETAAPPRSPATIQTDKAGNASPYSAFTHTTSSKPSGLPPPLPSPLRSLPQDINTSPAQRLVESVRREMAGQTGSFNPAFNQAPIQPSRLHSSGSRTSLRKDAWGCVHLRPSECELSIRFPQTPHYEAWDLEDNNGLFVTVPALLCLMAKPHLSWGSSPLAVPDISLLDIRCDAVAPTGPSSSSSRPHKRPRRFGPLHDPQSENFSITYSGIHTGTEMPDRLGHPSANSPYRPVVRLPSPSSGHAGRAFTFQREMPPMGSSPPRGELPGESIMIERWTRAYTHPGVEGLKEHRRQNTENRQPQRTPPTPPVIDIRNETITTPMNTYTSTSNPFLPSLNSANGLNPRALALLSQSLSNANANTRTHDPRPMSSPNLALNGWYLKVWIPIPTRLFRKSESKKFRISARVWISSDIPDDADDDSEEESDGGYGPHSASSMASVQSDKAPFSPFEDRGGGGGAGQAQGQPPDPHSPLSSRFSYGQGYEPIPSPGTGGRRSRRSSDALPLVADAEMSISVLRSWREMPGATY